MNSEEIQERLKALNIEDFIWIIYLGIILLSYYSNSIERKYFEYNNEEDKEKYRSIMILIFSILIFVYIYFLQDSVKSLINLKPSDSSLRKNLVFLSFIASLLIAISGFIFLYIAIKDKDVEVELAFN